MKVSLRYIGIAILVLCGVLTACSGNPADDEPLPTLAQLPTVTPVVNAAATVVPSTTDPNASLEPKSTLPVEPTSGTPNPIVLPDSLVPTATAVSEADFSFEVFPEVLEVGTKITLQGTFTTDDVNSGAAILTNSKGQSVDLLVDPFTAMTANQKEVQITGIVEQQAGKPANAVRVTEINMLDGTTALATATEPLMPEVPTDTP